MDDAAFSRCGGWGVYAVDASVGTICRMGGGDDVWDRDGVGAWVEGFGVSDSSFRRHVCDVCGGAGVGAEPGGSDGADCAVSFDGSGRGKRCDGCGGLCWVGEVAFCYPQWMQPLAC